MGELTKKEQAFALFDEGKVPKSAEVKVLGLKGSTRYNYYYAWQRQSPFPSSEPGSEGKVKGSKVISELAMVTATEKVKEEEGEKKEDEEELAQSEEGLGKKGEAEEGPPAEEKKDKPTDGKRPPTMIAGQGLTFAITISTKTLMLYQIAASRVEEELTLGDFIDVCVEDTYQGRGLDLGLVKIGGTS